MESLAQIILEADVTEGCAMEYLDNGGQALAHYVCSKCSLLASKDTDGIIYSFSGNCKEESFDASGHSLVDITE